MFDIVMDGILKRYPMINGKLIDKDSLFFEQRVKMNCFYCGRYGNNWKCPPNLPDIDYEKMVREFDNAAFIWLRMEFFRGGGITYEGVRQESSIVLHKALLEAEKVLYENNCSMAVSFIGGSCKLCKNGCGKDKCNNPYLSRTPVEAIGINVVKSAKENGISITFPPENDIIRIGLLLW